MASLRCLVAPDSLSPLNLALQQLELRLLGWASDQQAFAAVLLQAFGVEAGGEAAEDLRATLLGAGLEVGLAVQPLPGLRGAYAAASGSAAECVLLDGAWLALASADELEAVLLEELGHAMDQRLRGAIDSLGDEGELFSALLRGVTPSAASAWEDDHHWIEIAGEPRWVEAADTTAARVLLSGFRNPVFAGSASSGLPSVGLNASPTFVDIDGDGDLDAFIGNSAGLTVFFRNTGNASFANSATPFDLPDVGSRARPSFVDIDSDGDLDAFIGNYDGSTFFFRNTGSKTNAAFAAASSDFSLPDVGMAAAPGFADIDADGDLDAFIGNFNGDILFLRNTGTKTIAAFAGSSIGFALPNLGYEATPALADIDGDGDLDLFVGGDSGSIVYFKNTGTATNAAFAASSIGFGFPDLGYNASPTFADLDSDGDLDCFIGTGAGDTVVFSNDGNSALNSASADGIYGSGASLLLQVSFTDVVHVTGTPNLQLETGSIKRTAAYISGSGSNTLSFMYTVVAGDASTDLDVTSSTALQLNGGTIKDAAGNDALLTLPAPGTAGSLGANAALVVDAMAPILSGSSPGDGATGVVETGLIQLNFSEAVQPGSGLIKLWRADGELIEFFDGASASGSAGGYVSFSGSSVRIVPSLDFASSTAYYLTIADTAITDLSGNTYAGIQDATGLNFITGDSICPSVTDISSISSAGSYAPGSDITLAIRFSELVRVVPIGGVPSLLLETGSTDRSATYLSGSGSDTLYFTYTVQSGDSAADLSYTATDALRLNGGSIRDEAGNPANLTLPGPDSPGSLGFNASLLLDGVAPAVTRYGSTNTAFAAGSVVFGQGDGVIYAAKPAVADIDGDGDFDVFIGENEGNILFYQNSGTQSSAAFAASAVGFNLPDVGFNASPAFADIDTDGDLDAFIGNEDGNTLFFRNTGTRFNAAFAASSVGFNLSDVGSNASPAFVDIDADGDLDALIGNHEGKVVFFRNSGTSTSAAFTGSSIGAGLPAVDFYASPSLADIDGDGDFDAFVGNGDGNSIFFRNTGTPASPAFAGGSIAFNLPRVGNHASPSLADMDGDGDLDAFIGTIYGNTLFFRNSGTAGLFSPTANGGHALGSVITIQVPFSEDVIVESNIGSPPFLMLETGSVDRIANYSGGSGTNTLSFQYIVQSGDSAADLDVLSTTALQLNGGKIRDALGNNATLLLPAPGTVGSLGANAALVIDGLQPTVTSLTSTTANGRHGPGKVITVQVRFSEVVTVQTGSAAPTLLLETGNTDRLATYSGGSGSNTLVFNYTVQAGDVSADLDAASTSALQLNQGSISDLVGNSANLTLPAPGAAGSLGANAALAIDGVAPAVTASGLTSSNANVVHGVGQVITILVPFTEVVSVDTTSGSPILWLETGTTDRFATYLSGSGTSLLSFQYTVQPGDASADLDVTSTTALDLNGATIADAAGNPALLTLAAPGTVGSLGANAALVIDSAGPAVTALTSTTTNGTYGVGSVITILVTFSETVTVNIAGGSPTLLLETGAIDRTATYQGGSGTNTLRFQYTVQSGDSSADLDVVSTSALQLNGANIRTGLNNPATLTLPAPGTAGSLAANAALVVDADAPAVSLSGARNPGFAGSSLAFALPSVNGIARPALVDIDGDGDLDAFIGNSAGDTFFFRNSGTPANAAFAGSSIGFGLPSVTAVSSPSLVDIDADSDLDLFIGEVTGKTLFFRNTGTKQNPAFAASSLAFGIPSVTSFTAPTFVDIDADGDFDAFIGEIDGNTRFYRNSGSPTRPAFAGSSIAFGLADVGFSSAPSFADIDADGDFDAFIGNIYGEIIFFRNTGSASRPAFAGSSFAFGLTDIGFFSAPTFVDIDADADLDAFIGDSGGNTLFFRNTGLGGLTSPTPNGSYGVGSMITIQVPFTKPVTVNTSGGTPSLLLETGTVDRKATYISGSGSSTLQFLYTVQNGDSSADLDVVSSSALQLNGGTIRDARGVSAMLTLPTPGTIGSLSATSVLVIATQAISLTSSNPLDNAIGVSESANLQLIFSKTVTAGSGLIGILNATGDPIELFEASSGIGSSGGRATFSGNTLTINPFADLPSNTSLYLIIADTAVIDGAGNFYAGFSNPNTLNFTTGDNLVPSVTSISSATPNGTFGMGAMINLRVRFSKAVTVDTSNGAPSLLLETGSTDRTATYLSGSGTDTLSFSYSVQSGDSSADLDVASSTALQLNGATIVDAAGNTASLTLPAPAATGSLGAAADLEIDGSSPQILALTTATPTVTEGSSLNVKLNSSYLAAGATLYWSLSGPGITAADFTPSVLTGSLNLGNDRAAVFSRTVALDGVKEANEELKLTLFSDAARTLPLAGAQITLRDLSPTGPADATDDRDLIIGTSGNDTISGVPAGSLLNGRSSWDTLTGNGGNDLFILGSARSIYYDDGQSARVGTNDLATITDFNSGDRIQLKGSATDYRLSNATLSGTSGTLLYWRTTAGAGSVDEAIGFLQGLISPSLSLTSSSQFLYV
ncbi:MAG: FG-GAP-like repeat-containing protein [Cyanobacteriota bacterium]